MLKGIDPAMVDALTEVVPVEKPERKLADAPRRRRAGSVQPRNLSTQFSAALLHGWDVAEPEDTTPATAEHADLEATNQIRINDSLAKTDGAGGATASQQQPQQSQQQQQQRQSSPQVHIVLHEHLYSAGALGADGALPTSDAPSPSTASWLTSLIWPSSSEAGDKGSTAAGASSGDSLGADSNAEVFGQDNTRHSPFAKASSSRRYEAPAVDIQAAEATDSAPTDTKAEPGFDTQANSTSGAAAMQAAAGTSAWWGLLPLTGASRGAGMQRQASITAMLPQPCLPPDLAKASMEHLPHQLGTHGRLGSFMNAAGLRLACYFYPAHAAVYGGGQGPQFGDGSHEGSDVGSPGADQRAATAFFSADGEIPEEIVQAAMAASGRASPAFAAEPAGPVTTSTGAPGDAQSPGAAANSSSRVRGTVVLVHGHGSHIGFDYCGTIPAVGGQCCTYEGSWIQALNRAGFSVAALDLQGMGRSEGKRCFVHRFKHYCADFLGFVGAVTAGIAGLPGFDPASEDHPLFLMGISLGGGIVTHVMRTLEAAQQEANVNGTQPEIPLPSGAILLAPMLSLGGVEGKNWALRRVADLLDVLWPSLAIVQGGGDNQDKAIQEAWDHCPLTSKCKATRVRNALEYLRACSELEEDIGSCSFPFMVAHCAEDAWTDSAGSRQLYKQSKTPESDKVLHLLPGRTHTLTKGEVGAEVLGKVLDWLRARTPGKA